MLFIENKTNKDNVYQGLVGEVYFTFSLLYTFIVHTAKRKHKFNSTNQNG